MTPEGLLKDKCRTIARAHGLIFWNQEGKAINGLPDTKCGMHPKGAGLIDVEFKRDGEAPTAQQWKRIREIREAGGLATYVDNVDDWKRAVGLLPYGDHHIRYREP